MTPAISLSPKTLFQKQEAANRSFVAISRNEHFHMALSAALAEYAQGQHVSEEKLKGARGFINILLNISQVDEGRKPLPTKTLDHHAVYQPEETPQEKV